MRTKVKPAFRPSLESFEARIVAAGGVTAAAAHHAPHAEAQHPTKVEAPVHVAAQHSTEAEAPVHVAARHSKKVAPAHQSAHAAKSHANPTADTSASRSQKHSRIPTPAPTLPGSTASNEAWVEFVNMTGRDLQFQLSLAPYANGQFLTFEIGPGETQSYFSSLISHGRRVQANFAIEFGNGPVTPLMTGVSQQSAQGYYIFMDSNFQYYVSPFFRS
jgi:hypothetical protein